MVEFVVKPVMAAWNRFWYAPNCALEVASCCRALSIEIRTLFALSTEVTSALFNVVAR